MTSRAEMTPDETPARKLRKVTRACDSCKAKKKACTGNIPCGPCSRRHLQCTYETAYNRGVAASPPPSEVRPQHSTRDHVSSTASTTPQGTAPAVWDRPSSPLVSPPSVSERSEEPLIESSDRRGDAHVAGQYWGPTSAHSFLGRVVQDLDTNSSRSVAQNRDQVQSSNVSIFSFGDRIVPEVRLADFRWPSRVVADRLVFRYFEFAAPTYRILHQPTVEDLLDRLYRDVPEHELPTWNVLESAPQAILLMVFTTANMFQADEDGRIRDADERGWETSELYYTQANHLLSRETGEPSLASVQARFLMVLYFLCTSRARKAWFTFGTTVQLMMALGMHSKRPRRSAEKEDLVQKECRRRVVWCSYTLDKYLSVILGRPRLWQDDDIDEELPTRINDQDLTSHESRTSRRDCLMDAPVFHTKLAQILTQAARAPYVVTGISSREQIGTIQILCGLVGDWQRELPPFLSGAIQPSTLIPVFRRQLTVLQLARYHALMFITRPLLLRNYGRMWPDCEPSYQHYLNVCLAAARDAIEMILSFVCENQFFPAFWYSQYIAFNALSIMYLYLIQVQRGSIPPATHRIVSTPGSTYDCALEEPALYQLSETAQEHLAHATARNAPSWKYSAILQGLRRELTRLGPSILDLNCAGLEQADSRPGMNHQPNPSTVHHSRLNHPHNSLDAVTIENLTGSHGTSTMLPRPNRLDESFTLDAGTESLFDNFAIGEDLNLDFWPQLDSLPSNVLGY
ncbi:hypothetical protein P170DRAFT_507151 [Aspergillus steynii IBT 23096]|uniref:Zn(2)-C6 fungal-type domain-containing protein n=1 Tax=Aspergillus steynii IBT 23096 TaxID=1392250 RepID=A0A2I2GHI1_9EURO|nr:uncharacterized protein P170DRAFT_507151 [Aspergillus steynii IBT 23096]PLB52341.1 hypothetical protein P170DRAFT_507151 [Aspergillus steynii IBT 23096]